MDGDQVGQALGKRRELDVVEGRRGDGLGDDPPTGNELSCASLPNESHRLSSAALARAAASFSLMACSSTSSFSISVTSSILLGSED